MTDKTENKPIEVGSHCRFTYPDYGTPDSHPDYTAHSGQIVLVERQLTDAECDPECGPAYWVKASDGWVGNAHASELSSANLSVWDNLVLERRYAVGHAARRNRRSYSGTALHRIVILEVVAVIDEAAELAKKPTTFGQRFLKTRQPVEFSSYPACGSTHGQHAAREVKGAFITCKKCA